MFTRRHIATIASVTLFLILCQSAVYGWGNKGHEIVGFIAEAHLTETARKKITAILLAGETLPLAATWPDETGRRIQDFDRLHYVSVPDDANGYEQARDCKARNCIVEALKWFTSVLADTDAPINLRRIALRFVAHLVGDAHQPLHAGRREDRNGTDTVVSYKGQTNNLHLFWDINLVEMMEEGSADVLARRLDASIPVEERNQWRSGNPKAWIDESFRLSRSHAYNLEGAGELSDEYITNALPIVRRRLVQGGIRLAWWLNETLK
jgi:hypothetical protein